MVQLANCGATTPAGTLAHFLAADYVRSDYIRPHLKSKTSYLTPDEQILAKSDYLRPNSPRKCSDFLTPNEMSLARSDYLRPPLSPGRTMRQPRSSLSLKADSVDVGARCETFRPRIQHQSYSYGVHTLRRQPRAVSPPCDCLPTEPIPPPELFDF